MKNTIMLIKEMITSYINQDKRKLHNILYSGTIRWDFFTEQIIKHKLIPLAFYTLNDEFEKSVPFYLSEWISQQYYFNRYNTIITEEYIGRLTEKLREKQIPYVIVKGIALDTMLYKGDYIKKISDVDLLINSCTIDDIKAFLNDNNIFEGKYDYRNDQVIELSRKNRLLFMITKDHLSEYIIKTENPVVNSIKLDISINNDWIERGKENIFSDAIRAPHHVDLRSGYSINVMKHEFHFLYMIMHTFRHAWSYRFVTRNISVRLSMFNDIFVYWFLHKDTIKKGLMELMVQDSTGEIKKQVSWVIYHVDSLYGTNICEEMGLTADKNLVNKAYNKNGDLMEWEGGIERRLWSRNEIDIFTK